jgi:hypothetical protein
VEAAAETQVVKLEVVGSVQERKGMEKSGQRAEAQVEAEG